MRKKRRVSISFKLISTTTILLIFVIGLFGAINVRLIDDIYRKRFEIQDDLLEKQLQQNATTTAKLVAQTSARFLDGTQYNEIQTLVEEQGKEPNVVSCYVVDKQTKQIVAHSDKTLSAKAKSGKLPYQQDITDHTVTRKIYKGNVQSGEYVLEIVVPAMNRLGVVTGLVVMGFSSQFLMQAKKNASAERKKEFEESLRKTLILGLIMVILGVMISILQGLRITKPIKDLARTAEKIAQGNLSAKANIKTSDEIGILGENFNYMAKRIVYLLEDTEKKAIFQKELEIASAIQETMIPQPGLIEREKFKFAGFFKAASICGGDWWNFQDLSNGRVLVIIGDVTGHGVPSAILTATAKSCVDTIRNVKKSDYSVSFLLGELNKVIYDTGKGKFFMTCFAAVIDSVRKRITFANAGHNFPYRFFVEDGAYKLSPLVLRGNRLGDTYTAQFPEKTVDLQQNDVIVWYTDGMVECDNEDGVVYGDKRFRRAIQKSLHYSPEVAIDRILDDFNRFREGNPLVDDITMIMGKVS